MVFADGLEIFAWNGIEISRELCESELTIPLIHTVRTELQVVLIDRYGRDRYLRDARAMLVARDDYGSLWEVRPLRVPLAMRSAHEAVAWTFGLSEMRYHPSHQS